MFITMNRIPVHQGQWPDFEERFRNRIGLVDQAPGFIRNMVLRPTDDTGDCHIVLTMWENREAFENWTKSDSFLQAHYRARQDAQKAKETFKGPSKLETFESVTDTGA
ncbi:MAG TPA: antibiotic biosynthesis monooxygenase [Mariprofundaceae bacterium]|nr:antibiotic biosynthesis monooxygenase [Mariprofundaceae bacterium]